MDHGLAVLNMTVARALSSEYGLCFAIRLHNPVRMVRTQVISSYVLLESEISRHRTMLSTLALRIRVTSALKHFVVAHKFTQV